MTLVSKIRRILELPETPDREKKVKRVIDSYRKSYPLLEDVIQNKTTFEEAYQPLIKKHKGIKAFLPKWIAKYETRIPKENKRLIYDYGSSSPMGSLIMNPLSLATVTAGFISIGHYSAVYRDSMSAYFFSGAMGLISSFMIILTGVSFFMVPKAKNDFKKDLRLLDEQIDKLHKGGMKNEIKK